MLFSSLSFLFFFLPVVLLLYYPLRFRRWRNGVLLAASLLFYSWGEPRFLPVLLAAALIGWLGGMVMSFFPKQKKCFLVLSLVLLLGNLFLFKYLGFAAENLAKLFGLPVAVKTLPLPLGISFFTFQILSYVIDLYRGKIRLQKNPLRLLLYVSFFPQLIAGPIVRYQTVEEELVCRQESLEDLAAGFQRFVIGLAKKVLLANSVAWIAESLYAGGDPSVYGSAALWLAMLAYTLQIYYDFSGYSDMAIGLGQMFGFHFPENFRHPYAALSVTEFWRRWHISLSGWFRDYVYIPLGGNRVSRLRWIRNLMIVWSLTGLWHGASWNFVLWGLYYGILLILEKLIWGKALEKLPVVLRWLYTFLIISLGWVLFNLTDFSVLLDVLVRMFRFSPSNWSMILADSPDLFNKILYVPIGLLLMFPLPKKLTDRSDSFPTALRCGLSVLLLILCVIWLLSSSYNPFIYFRF
ncbi:MAG: MBOAT family protein [Oscillospiraceae bacterium]|nr:MBOAT family protein [Oscillospiraceae bacterium]